MSEITISSDTDTILPDPNSVSIPIAKSYTTVLIVSNVDVATLTFGKKTSAGFVAFPDGAITNGKRINHGSGTELMVRTSGIGANPVIISYD